MAVDAVRDSRSSSEPDQAVDAKQLIAEHTDANGRVDTQGLANLVEEAATQDPDKASAAYQDIENALAARNPTDASHFAQDTVARFAAATAGTAVGALKAGRTLAREGAATIAEGAGKIATATQTLKDNPILSKRWTNATSAWTGKGGFSGPLRDLLDQQGISYNRTPLRAPAGSIGKGAGVPKEKANNINGDLLRDQQARQHRAAGAKVETEVPIPGTSRRVDVRADYPGSDATHGHRLEEETKVGYHSADAETRAQVLKDGQRLRANAAVRKGAESLLKEGEGLTRSGEAVAKAGKALEVGGKVLLPVAVAADAVQLYGAFKEDGDKIGVHTGKAAAEVAGGWGGAIAGAEAGAALGSLAGPAGTVVGGVVGGVAGGLAGSKVGDAVFDAGRSAFDKLKSLF